MVLRRRAVTVATVVAAAALCLGASVATDARQSVKIAFGEGRVSLVAEEALVSDVLAEWSRVGKTEIVGAELVEKRRVTVVLEDVSEGEAIEAMLGKAFGFVEMAKSIEPGLSSISRLVIGKAPEVDRSTPPEAQFSYYVGEKMLAGEDFGKPEYKVLEKLPPAPETIFDYFAPEKAVSDYGKPVYEPLDPRWVIPELRFEYLLKDFPKFEIADFVRTPTTYPEVRFKYFCGPKAAPCW
jgi:hypothetical protein